MSYVFIDESGDLGFGEKSSQWFILSLIFVENHRRVEKCVKKVHKSLKKKYKKVGELHAYHADVLTRKRILRLLAGVSGLRVLCIILNKKKVYIDFRKQKNYLYNYTANILLDRMQNKGLIEKNNIIRICIDQRETNKFLQKNFEEYLRHNLIKKSFGDFEIKIKPSHSEKCLQAADFISWAIYRKYEKGDYEYYKMIEKIIIEENLLFP